MSQPKKTNGSKLGNRKGKAQVEKPKTPSLIRYEELLERMKAHNLPPTDIVADEKRLREMEGF